MKPKILSTLPGYSRPDFVADMLAGISVALVALPLSLAIAIASGADPGVGLITAIVGGFFISALGGSRVQIGGPTGAFIVVVYGVIATYGMDGLVLATLMAGLILIVAGYLRAGRLIALVPEPVINGFTIGIGIIIGNALFQLSFLIFLCCRCIDLVINGRNISFEVIMRAGQTVHRIGFARQFVVVFSVRFVCSVEDRFQTLNIMVGMAVLAHLGTQLFSLARLDALTALRRVAIPIFATGAGRADADDVAVIFTLRL